jgi:hypothetical protein
MSISLYMLEAAVLVYSDPDTELCSLLSEASSPVHDPSNGLHESHRRRDEIEGVPKRALARSH